MIKKNPSGLTRVKAADAFAKQLGHLDVVVALHSSHAQSGQPTASVDLLPERSAAGSLELRLFDPPMVKTVAEARESVTLWRRGAVQAEYQPLFLPGFPDYITTHVGDLVLEMARVGAFAGSPVERPYHISHAEPGSNTRLDALERLQDVKLVEATFFQEDQSAWLLNMEALQHCKMQMRLESPKPAFSPPEGRPALSWSRMELLSYLDLRGWECHYLAGPDEQGSVLNLDLGFRRSDDKCIYIVQGRLLHHYLCCLSFIDAALPLRLQDGATEFRHFESEPYYARLLGVHKSQKQQLCALADQDAPAGLPASAFQIPQVGPDTYFSADPAPLIVSESAPEPELVRDHDGSASADERDSLLEALEELRDPDPDDDDEDRDDA